jgi:hypothetical protein
MTQEVAAMTLEVQELHIPWLRSAFEGRLLAAIPSGSRPDGLSPETWASQILTAAHATGAQCLAIPVGFWPGGERSAAPGGGRWIEVMDTYPGLGGPTPLDSVRDIVSALATGEDVLCLSATRTVSGFIPAILSRLSDAEVHIEKVVWPVMQGRGYELTPFQIGYLYGLGDAKSSEMRAVLRSLAAAR